MEALSRVEKQFILHWGEMSSRWGINRSMAQIHALLFLSPDPLAADQIAGSLSIARSNVSSSLRELQAWGVVRVVHKLGDRRDHFETMEDAWEMFRVILEERKRREVDPTVAMLEECVAQTPKEGDTEVYARRRMKELLELLRLISVWYEQMEKLPVAIQKKVLKMGRKIQKIAG